MKKIDITLKRAIDAGDVPGVVGVVANGSGTQYEGAFGTRLLNSEKPMTLDTVFRIASMTKAVASVAAMQLYEKDAFSLDQPANEILPDFHNPSVLQGFTDEGEPQLRPAASTLTPRHLLTHTAGFGYEMWNSDLGKYQETTGQPGITSGQKSSLRMPLVCDPGSEWIYGISTDWVGMLVEAISGKTLGEYLREHVFEPLGMHDTTFTRSTEQDGRTASIHQRGTDGQLTALDINSISPNADYESGGGGLSSTARDYLAFTQMILKNGTHNGAQILKPETVGLMGENHIGDLTAGHMLTAMPQLSNDVNFTSGGPHKHGLGFLINSTPIPGARAVGSLSWAGLFNSYYWIDPLSDVTGVIMMQLLPFFDAKSVSLYEAFERATYETL